MEALHRAWRAAADLASLNERHASPTEAISRRRSSAGHQARCGDGLLPPRCLPRPPAPAAAAARCPRVFVAARQNGRPAKSERRSLQAAQTPALATPSSLPSRRQPRLQQGGAVNSSCEPPSQVRLVLCPLQTACDRADCAADAHCVPYTQFYCFHARAHPAGA